MAISEYVLHRWFMHKPTLGRNWVYIDHAVRHHGHGDNSVNIDLPIYFHLLLGSPFLIGAWLIGGFVSLFAVLCVFMHHSFVWTHAHRCIHGLENHWLEGTTYYVMMKKHHEGHHCNPRKNFGVVYPWTDYLFRTKLHV